MVLTRCKMILRSSHFKINKSFCGGEDDQLTKSLYFGPYLVALYEKDVDLQWILDFVDD